MTRGGRSIGWFIPACLAALGLFALAQGTMPGLIFSLVLVGLALFCAAQAYAGSGDDAPPPDRKARQRRTMTLLGVLALTAAVSCRMPASAAPVPVAGSQEDVGALSGEWEGSFWSRATGRHGVIRFNLPERADTGYGEVEITFSPALELLRDSGTRDERLPKPSTVLDITVIRVERGRVEGTMAPYWDPDCDCRTRTVFAGRIWGDRISGTFHSQRASSDPRVITGEWRAERGTIPPDNGDPEEEL